MVNKSTKNIYEVSLPYFKKGLNAVGLREPKDSYHLLQWILRHSSLQGYSLLISATIATYWDKSTNIAHPSINQIAAVTGLAPSTVNRHIPHIKTSGEWLVFPERRSSMSGGSKANNYIPISPRATDKSEIIPHHFNQLVWTESWLKKEYISNIELTTGQEPKLNELIGGYILYLNQLDKEKYIGRN